MKGVLVSVVKKLHALLTFFFRRHISRYLATFLVFQFQNHATKELSWGRSVTSQNYKPHQKMLIYVFRKEILRNLAKQGSFLTTHFKL